MEYAVETSPGEWADTKAAFLEHIGSLQPSDFLACADVRREDLISAPEAMDAKTDASAGWETLLPLDELVKQKKIPDVSTFTPAEVLDIMDVELSYLQMYLAGGNAAATFLGCVYPHRLSLLESHPLLFAFFRGVIKLIDVILNSILNAGVSDDDEFALISRQPDTLNPGEIDAILRDLDAAIKSTAQDKARDAFHHRLRFIAQLLRMNQAFEHATKQSVSDAHHITESLIEIAGRIVRPADRPEPILNTAIFNDACPTWCNLNVPQPRKPLPPFATAISWLTTMVRHFGVVCGFAHPFPILNLLAAFNSFGRLRPCVPVRSRLMLVMCTSEESFFLGEDLGTRILREVAEQYGAPLYLKIVEGSSSTLEADVDAYRRHILLESGYTQAQLQAQLAPIKDSVKHWAYEVAGRTVVQVLIALLRNRGRALRTLVNHTALLANSTRVSWEIEAMTFAIGNPMSGAQTQEAAMWSRRSSVLSSFIVEVTHFVLDTILSLNIELDLPSPGEVLPFLWYRAYLSSQHIENLLGLFIPPDATIPAKQYHRRTNVPMTAPVVTSRVPVAPSHHYLARIDLAREFANTSYSAVAALGGAGLVAITLPETSLVSAEQMFEYRLVAFRNLQRPLPRPYADAMKQYAEYADPEKFADVIGSAIAAYQRIAGQTKRFLEATGLGFEIFSAVEKTATKNALALSMILKKYKSAPAETNPVQAVRSAFEVLLEYPLHPATITFTLKIRV